MSDARHFRVDAAINPYYVDGGVSSEIAQSEHDSIKAALEEAGVVVVTTPSPVESQDGVYTANWALVRGEKAVLARLPEVRRAEESVAKSALEALGKTVHILPEGLKFSGQGDALACGKYLFCGMGYRSDEEAQKLACELLGYEHVQLQAIPQVGDSGEPIINSVSGWPDSYFYDIDLALAIIRVPDAETGEKGLIAYCTDALTEESVAKLESLEDIETIVVSYAEASVAFATNLVSTGEVVIMSDRAPELSRQLEGRGLRVLTPSITELRKGGGYIRCTTLTLN